MAESRLTPEINLNGITPEEAFAILGNETRVDIIRTLWRAGALHEYDDVDSSDTTMSFSELRRRVDIADNGQFNYHLSKLVPHFVRQTDDGYRLSGAGKDIARTVVAISGERDPEVSRDLETACPLCGSPLSVTYEDYWLRFSCTECDGLFGDTAPGSAVLNSSFPRAGLTDRSPEDALTTGMYRCHLDLPYLMRGICRECASPMSTSVAVCEDHDTEDGPFCDTCETPFAVWVEPRCETCRFAKRLPVELSVMGFTPVISFLYEDGIDVLSPSIDEVVDVIGTRFDTTVSRDPLRITVTIEGEDDELTLELDDRMNVLDTSR